jgi:16S rRNA (cytosine967-C5)-methyltransferase
MHLDVQIQATIQMLDIFFTSKKPFDIVMAKFFRNNKWIGASDRREITEFSFAMFRNFEKLRFFISKITSNFAVFYTLAFLRISKNLTVEEISKLFCGRQFAPQKLTEFEFNFVNSINCSREFPAHVRCNYPQWMAPYLQKVFSPGDIENEMLFLNEKAPVDLRVNTLKVSKNEVKQMLVNSGFQVEETKISVNGLRIIGRRIGRNHEVIANGLAEIQDEGSQLIAEVCGAMPGNTVIDFCAGAGGKTLAMAAMMSNKGRIFALDKYQARLENAKARLRKANIDNVFCQEITNKWIKRHLESADIVLVDAPCSGIGTWRRNPDMRAHFTQQTLDELVMVQEQILETSQRLVKKGGRLIYATCSILKEENYDQIEKFLRKFPKFSLFPIKLQNYSGDFLQLSPHKTQTDGFFAAQMLRD